MMNTYINNPQTEISSQNNNSLKIRLKNYYIKIKSDISERNRFLMLAFAAIIIIDYLMFSFITERNPFKIFPSIPILENISTINIYVPDIDGKTILKEKREIEIPEDNKAFIKKLINLVIKGSNSENTAITVPVKLFTRNIWLFESKCVIDIDPSILESKKKSVKNSYPLFKESLEKTIIENFPSINNIILLEKGIPGRNLWK